MKRRNFIKMMGFGSVGLGVGANSPLPLLEPVKATIDFNSGQKLIKTGIPELDFYINGFVPGELVLIGGRPRMGKTQFALQIARTAALKNNQCVAYFNLKMTKETLMTCLLCQETGKGLHQVMLDQESGKNSPEVIYASEKISSSDFFIDDSQGLFTKNVQTGLDKIALHKKADLVIIDYLQLMQASGICKTRYDAIENILTDLKKIAVQNNLSMIVLAQFPGDINRPDKRPKLRDFRFGSPLGNEPIGDLESIDKAILLYRERYYYPDVGHNLIEYHIAKNLIGYKGYVLSKKSSTVYMADKNKFLY